MKSTSVVGPIWRVCLFLLAFQLGVIFLFLCAPGVGKAAEFSLEFDDAVVETGRYPALRPGSDRRPHLAPTPDKVVRMTGSIEAGVISVPATGVQIADEVRGLGEDDGYLVRWEADSAFDGSFDAGTGKLVLRGLLTEEVLVGGNTCSVGPVLFTLTTELSGVMNQGRRFTEGLAGSGTLVGKWSAPALDSVTGCDASELSCYVKQDLLSGSGDIAFSTDRVLKVSGPASIDFCNPPRPAGGPVVADLLSGPASLGFPAQSSGSYQLKLVSGPEGSVFRISLRAPGWPGSYVHGSPLRFGAASASGTKSFAREHRAIPMVGYTCASGALGYEEAYGVQMDPNMTALVNLPVELVAQPWTSQPVTPTISVEYFQGMKEVQVPPVSVAGRLSAATRVWAKGRKNRRFIRLNTHRSLRVAGQVSSDATLAGRKVRLWADQSGSGRRVNLGLARLDFRGRFDKKVRISRRGAYEFEARVLGLADGPTCGVQVMVSRPGSSRNVTKSLVSS